MVEPQFQKKFAGKFIRMDARYAQYEYIDAVYQNQITAILTNDIYFTKLHNFEGSQELQDYRREWRKKVW
jgi:hypothetical protein